MLTRRCIAVGGLIALAVPIPACGRPKYTMREKLTVELEVDGEIKSGFNVVEHVYSWKTFPEKRSDAKSTGEALYLDLGDGRKPLIVLLTIRDWEGTGFGTWSAYSLIARAKGHEKTGYDEFGKNKQMAKVAQTREAIEIAPSNLPDLVTFDDPLDPTTVERVDPNDLEATLGSDVAWRRITVEVTDEDITTGLEQNLPWVATMKSQLDGKMLRYHDHRKSVSNMLGITDFKRRSL